VPPAMSPPIVVAQNLVKWYGPRLAVRDVSFTIDAGEVVGLLGPNGSGKSTIFRILTGYLTPSSGTVSVAGHDAVTDSLALRRQVGYVPEDTPLYDHMRVAEFLRFMARIKGLSGPAVSRSVASVAARLRLAGAMDTPIAKLSRGFRQRVAIAQALLNEPKLLVLDEPTSGLDPSQVNAFRDLVRELAGAQTVLIASHVLPEIAQIAGRVMILLDGTLLTTDALKRGAHVQHLRLQVEGPETEVRACLAAVTGVHAISAQAGSGDASTLYIVEAERRPLLARDVAAALAERRLALSELAAVPPDLEQVFLELTRRRDEVAA
jgi:gliding motility-associated transport system ATP-binding protein